MYFWLCWRQQCVQVLGAWNNSIIEARDAEFFEDKFIKYKGLLLKDIAENTSISNAPDEPVS